MNQNMNQSAVIEEISPEEAAGVFGGNKARYRVMITKLKGNRIRRVKRIVTRKAVTRLIRLSRGKYTVRYKRLVTRTKQTASHGNSGYRPANDFF
ncbi:MAG: hypothetical protein ACIAZJ_21650 [Gimesia chilikensis]|uniref:hypothetical protein n=1 Tax=Gimesia chilikensis TaxID=2605989 RepID=UPI0037930CCB